MQEILAKIKRFTASKNFVLILSLVGLYLVSTGASLIIFSLVQASSSYVLDENGKPRVDLSAPKTEECPINGGKFTRAERAIWEDRRPITAMVENHADSRPPSGISKADVVYEIVAEGGITRFLAVFYCGASAEEVKIAPVRSARIYFIDYAAEYGDNPIFMHVGGANDFSGSGDTVRDARALETLETIGWRTPKGNDFDTIYDSGFPVFWRNYERLDKQVATEHTMMASLDAAFKEAAERGFGAKDESGDAWDENFIPWKFTEGKGGGSVSNISFKFWDGKPEYDVEWRYDAANNQYLRFNGGKEHTDLETDSQLSARNVVVLFARERGPVDRNLHMLYTTIGTGDAIVFQNGEAISATWSKKSRTDRTKFLDEDGKEIVFVGGQVWIEVVPAGNEVDY